MIQSIETKIGAATYDELVCDCGAKLCAGYWPGPTWCSDWENMESAAAVSRWRQEHAHCQPRELVNGELT
jgi:hypothetical protein